MKTLIKFMMFMFAILPITIIEASYNRIAHPSLGDDVLAAIGLYCVWHVYNFISTKIDERFE
jgi:hypothetical protein